jgi:AbrB family looped-hinge helix DNA binding protein
MRAVISSKGQIVIPANLRKRLQLQEGTTVVFQEERGRLVLEPNNYEGDLRATKVGKALKWMRLPKFDPKSR